MRGRTIAPLINELYATHRRCDAQLSDNKPDDLTIGQVAIDRILKNIASKGFDPKKDIEQELFEHTFETLNRAVDIAFGEVNYNDDNFDFVNELKYNNAVFSAFKTHRQQNEIAAQMVNEKGKVRSFADFRKATTTIVGAYNTAWLQTEYNTAVIRASYAQQIKEAERDRDIFPNLEWLPSTSVNAREAHRALYGKIFAFDDPALQSCYPGSLWNCKCGIRSTSKPATHGAEIKSAVKSTPRPPAGLDISPASGALFCASHPYFVLGYMAYKKLRPIVEKFAKRTMIKYARKQLGKFSLQIPEHKGLTVISDNFVSGRMSVVRKTLKKDIAAHAENHQTIFDVVNFEKSSLKWEYVGWKECGKYPSSHKKAGQRKHPEVDYFTYYRTKISGKDYYVNVKMHKEQKREVLYTINSRKPDKIVIGEPRDLGKYKK